VCCQDNQVPVCPLCNCPVPLGASASVPDEVVGRHIDNDCQSETAQSRRKVCSSWLVFHCLYRVVWNFWHIAHLSTTNHHKVINTQMGQVFLDHPLLNTVTQPSLCYFVPLICFWYMELNKWVLIGLFVGLLVRWLIDFSSRIFQLSRSYCVKRFKHYSGLKFNVDGTELVELLFVQFRRCITLCQRTVALVNLTCRPRLSIHPHRVI